MPAEFNSFQDPLASLVSHFLFSSFHFPSPLIEHKPALPEWATLVFGPRRFFSVPFLKDDATTGSGAGGVFSLLVSVRRLRREVTLDHYF